MQLRKRTSLLLTIIFLHVCMAGKAQSGLCPSNLDFESGSFTGWLCKSWNISNPGGTLILGPIPGRHTIINAATAGVDPYGSFPEIAPNGSGFSMKLGNHSTGSQAESVSYTYTIPSTLSVFSMLFYYAVVIESPGHEDAAQPRFQARILDAATGLALTCVDFDFIAGNTPGGFKTSPIRGNGNSEVLYKDWTPISVNLNAYIGKTITLEFITKDCSQGGHAGYAYVDVSTACNGAIQGTTICQGDNSITLKAPFGFQSYKWYSDNTFTTLISTDPTLPLNPAPPVGTTFPIIVEPFTGFGCKDTLYATIDIAPKPISFAGTDVSICEFQTAQLGGVSSTGYTYQWSPAAQVSNPTISNPIGWNTPPYPDSFIVKTTDILTGCFNYDTVVIKTKLVDVAVAVSGPTEYCDGISNGAVLSVNNTSTAIKWFSTSTPIAGATAPSYKPFTTGNYWAELTQNGCKDSTAITNITIHPLPKALFTVNSDTACITTINTNSFSFTNTTTPANADNLWKFSDGITQSSTDATKIFPAVGTYTTELVTTTQFGCKDSTNMKVYVLPNVTANFTWDSVCVDRPVLFKNLGNENNSPLVKYNWEFNNGDPASDLKNPLPVTYTTPGRVDVKLTMTALGCENDPQTMVKKIQANKQAGGIRYRGITTAQGYSNPLQVRDTIGNNYKWRPQLQLSSYTTSKTQFFATNDDIDYRIDITDEHTCVTTDSILMQILRKPGYYLPTGFTPNSDGLNDIVKPYLVNMKELKSFSIYNRWGNLIFHTTKDNTGWDGKMNGQDQPGGVYVWALEFIDKDNKKILEKGTITLIR